MGTRNLAIAVGVAALVSTSAFAERGRGGERSSGHASSGHSASARGSSASSSRSGHASQYRSAAPRYSSSHGVAPRYRSGVGRSYGYRNYGNSSYRYRPYYGRSYYRPGFSLYLGAPYYYDSYYYGGGYYPETYVAAPYVTDDGYRGPAEDPGDYAAPPIDRDVDRVPDAVDSGRLRLDVRPADATIYVDDQFRGTAGDATMLALPRGRHTVEVARPGFQSERRVVEVGSGEPRLLSITLQPVRR